MPAPAASHSLATEAAPFADAGRPRILAQAREHLFAYGYSAFTMDDLARELGMSKKTVYVHFRSKDALIRAVLDGFAAEVRDEAEQLLRDSTLSFAEKLRGFASGMMERLSRVNPATLRDLQRFAPALHRHLEQLRGKNIAHIFGRFVEAGQICGAVRDDINPVFAGEFFLHAMQGLMQPAAMQRLKLSPDVTLDRAIGIFVCGLLTSTGRKEHDKLFPC